MSSGFHGMGLDSYYYSNVKSSNPLKDSEKEDLSLFFRILANSILFGGRKTTQWLWLDLSLIF